MTSVAVRPLNEAAAHASAALAHDLRATRREAEVIEGLDRWRPRARDPASPHRA
jgi:hypothetical protein